MKPAVEVVARAADDAGIPIGATKIAGCPDLPPGVPWPLRPAYTGKTLDEASADVSAPNTRWSWASPEQCDDFRADARARLDVLSRPFPLHFVAQFNLADAWRAGPLDDDMPRDGVLALFYDIVEMPWGFDPADRASFALTYNAPEGLERREQPAELTALTQYVLEPPLACALVPCASEQDADEPMRTQISGWPTLIQDDMRAQCALVTAGHYCGDATAYRDPKLANLRALADEWILLFQITSHEELGVTWGDAGQLYVLIRREDLRARRFDKAHLVLQCS